MKSKYILLKFWSLVVGVSLLLLIGVCFLPHDKYLRYKSLDVGVYAKAKWIYERTIFDDTPIDIAFIGTSHTLNAIDSEIVENGLNLGSGSKNKIHVVNFAIPHFGRDLHLVIAKFLIEHKHIKLLVVEVRESEARDMHPATHYLADPLDLVTAPLLVNKRYLNNLSQLPLRQFSLFFKTNLPFLFSTTNQFDSSDYLGAHLNFTMSLKTKNDRNIVMPVEALLKAKESYEIANKGKLDRTNKLKNFLFFNSNKTVLSSIILTAKERQIPVVFLYLPRFGAPTQSVDAAFYDSLAKTIIPPKSILSKRDIWLDLGHLNASGATQVSNWLYNELIQYYN